MYTSRSQSFCQDFKNASLKAINKAIEEFKGYDKATFARVIGQDYGSDEVQASGRRWKDAEQCFQAMVMRLERRMFQERGPGFMTDAEVASIQKMHFESPYLFALSAADGIIGAANCDHYYMFEKDWG